MTPLPPISALAASAEGRERAGAVKLVGLDVDGVLTDGGVYLGDVAGQRLEFKRYDIQDGLGIKMLQKAGIAVAIITGRVSDSVALRAQELEVDELVQDRHARKVIALREMARKRNIGLEEIAFVGDDLPDVGVFRVVGLSVVVANATPDAVRAAHYRLTRVGGRGAVREFAEALLAARGEWERIADWYVASREETTGV